MNTLRLDSVARLSNEDLLAGVRRLAQRSREVTAELIAHLAIVEQRRLYLGAGCSSLFTYCTEGLGLSEPEAYLRMETARTVLRFPVVLEHLVNGLLSMTAVSMVAKHLTAENCEQVLAEASHKTKRELKWLVARLDPKPPVEPLIRRLPSPAAALPETAARAPSPTPPPRPALIEPLAPQYVLVRFTASADLHAKLREAQDLLRNEIPKGEPERVFERALDLLLQDLRKKKLAPTEKPRAARPARVGSRHIPAALRRQVFARDGRRCAFVAPDGRRCSETGRLHLHHFEPFAQGGPTALENLSVRCARHNQYEAELVFGPRPDGVNPSQCDHDRADTRGLGPPNPG